MTAPVANTGLGLLTPAGEFEQQHHRTASVLTA